MKKGLMKTMLSKKHLPYFFLAILVGIVIASCRNTATTTNSNKVPTVALPDTVAWPVSFELGHIAKDSLIKLWDIDVRPDGKGLPKGQGTVALGSVIYANKCAACHGKTGVEGPYGALVGSYQFKDTTKAKTIGNYWPYATTIYDYINRAMPFNKPGTLTPDEVYSLTAFLLHKNLIIDSLTVVDSLALSRIVMPAQKDYVIDDRKGGPEIR
jgi:S-disulfanyl-L-cysteine oxidoreductase SoxD